MSAYDGLSEEELALLINELQEVRRKRKGGLSQSDLRRMLSPDSPDFMGSGMTVQEFMMAGELERLQNAYWRQSLEEKRRRQEAVVALATEYVKIIQQTRQATLWAREAFVAVLNGDWKEVKICRGCLSDEGEHFGLTLELKEIFLPFVKLLDEVLTGVPKEEPMAREAAS
jgi:hypothetical protein